MRILILGPLCLMAAGLFGQTPGVNSNMVTGTVWPGGDPFLQRQNEPSMAISSRNPLHILAGANDYRTVDIPFITQKGIGDAWAGVFKSYDGGLTWRSTLLPGLPQTCGLGETSPLCGMQAAADPWVRAGTNGMFYYAGLGLTRDATSSKIFVARFIDDNNQQGVNGLQNRGQGQGNDGDTIRYLDTHIITTGGSNSFVDKPTIAVDIPRDGSATCSIPDFRPDKPAQTFAAGKIYIVYTQFEGPDNIPEPIASIMFSESGDCGETWSPPVRISGRHKTSQAAVIAVDPEKGDLVIAWRVFKSSTDPSDAIVRVTRRRNKTNFSNVATISTFVPFDQGTTTLSFRTNAFPAIATDDKHRTYVTWTQRGPGPGGDARIVVAAAKVKFNDGGQENPDDDDKSPAEKWRLVLVDPNSTRGHQIMPALAFSSGKLTVAWYDFRNNGKVRHYTPSLSGGGNYSVSLMPDGIVPFEPFVADPEPPYNPNSRRHTVEVRAAQALPDKEPKFRASVIVSQFAFGSLPGESDSIRQLEVNPPNLPMFRGGTVPFFGDYIDVAGPTFIQEKSNKKWRFNTKSDDPDHTRIVWADNRNVVQPADGNWTNYTPVRPLNAAGNIPSVFDPAMDQPACIVGQGGSRNQDIYTAALSPGIEMGVKGNTKPLSLDLTRGFPVTVRNSTDRTRHFRLTIEGSPKGGQASFVQFFEGKTKEVKRTEISIPPQSSAARTVFLTSTDPSATVLVSAEEITQPGGGKVKDGLYSQTQINTDTATPEITSSALDRIEIYRGQILNQFTPDISNPNISNPNISNPNISNPNISNPNISNPNISNVSISNPNISNPNISNPNISNPNISNPNISNPNISNPNISNSVITDVSYMMRPAATDGSLYATTASTYHLSLVPRAPIPDTNILVQVLISLVYFTPSADGCTLAQKPNYVPVANFISPAGSLSSALTDPILNPGSATFALLPGEWVQITIRVHDFSTNNPAIALGRYNPATALFLYVDSLGVEQGE